MIKYASIYCKADVEVLKKGWIVFRDSLLSEYDIDVFSYPTMASLADAYFIEQGCFEGVHKMAGVPRAFIANASVGGRVMCADNQPVRTNEKLADFDGVSLYPSRSCTPSEILTFGCTALILSHDKLFSMSQVTPILTNMYITHNNTHMGPLYTPT